MCEQGNDLITEVKLDLFTAILGGQLKTPTHSGDVVLTIPAGTQPSQKFRLAGRGMPLIKHPGQFGDLFVKVAVTIPKQLTPHQRELFEKLRDLR